METTQNYKGYVGSAEIDFEQNICRGKVLFINDLITYKATTPAELQAEFEAAVDDYLQTCAELGWEPKKPASGTFNVRIEPEKHRRAQIRAASEGISLNELVGRALGIHLDGDHSQPVTTTVHYNTFVVSQERPRKHMQPVQRFTLTGTALETPHGHC